MREFNPYAPPEAEVALAPCDRNEGGVWRDGPLLVMSKDGELPDRCLMCNLPAHGWRLKRNLSWHPPFWYLLILLHILIYVAAALIVRKKATIMVPLCEKHRRRRVRRIAAAWLSVLGGFAAIVVGVAVSDRVESMAVFSLIGGAILLLTGLILGVLAAQVAVPKKID